MSQQLTDKLVRSLPAPGQGNRIYYDREVKGFGCRVTAAGTRSFILNYRTRGGRERRYTIGGFPDYTVTAARARAKELKQEIDRGEDPLADIKADREAPTMAALCQRFEEQYLPRKRPSTQRDYRGLIRREILPALRHLKVADVKFSDIDGLHRKITKRGAAYIANRTVAVLSKMFNLAVRWQWRMDNPAKGIERNHEQKRERYLNGDELARLTKALAEHEDQQVANIIRLLLLTGARRGEVLSMRWDQLDLSAGVWTKPSAATKQNKAHRVPLSPPAQQLLVELRSEAEKRDRKRRNSGSEYVFSGRGSDHRIDIKDAWAAICVAAGIVTATKFKEAGKERVVVKPAARVHDLRHTYASLLASAGLSLPIIGALLGHTQPATTARYSHLLDDPLRKATERVGDMIFGPRKGAGNVVPLKGSA